MAGYTVAEVDGQNCIVNGTQLGGKWILGRKNIERQRECMGQPGRFPKCQVCVKPLGKQPWWMVGGANLARVGGSANTQAEFDLAKDKWKQGWIQEPPVCSSCLAYALRVCPALIAGQVRKADLRVYRVYERVVMGTFLAKTEGDTDRDAE